MTKKTLAVSSHTLIRRLLLGSAAALSIASATIAALSAGGSPTSSEPGTALTSVRTADDLSLAFEHVAETINPAVVSVRSARRANAGRLTRTLPSPFRSMPFEDLFGDDWSQLHRPQERSFGRVEEGLGTGVILDEDGYIVTNNHVIKNADEVTVTLWDETSHTASIVGVDPKTDLAVLKIEAEELTPAILGDDSNLRVGHWVAAVGNPFGLSSTMTAGIVSAVGRSRVGLADYEDFIQTDAAINPGNSGGPLVNLAGEVVGINTAIFSRSGGYMGIGFAIPVSMVRNIADSLIEHGRVYRGFLGVMIQNLDKNLAASFGHESSTGALVSEVNPGSPAEEAGLVPGDIITLVDGKAIEDVDTLRHQVASITPGTETRLVFIRDGEEQEVGITIGQLESEPSFTVRNGKVKSIGMSLETVTPELARRLNMRRDTQGVLVTSVEPFGAAARGGVRLNDVILAVQGEPVANVAEFERVARDSDLTEGVRLTVQTGAAKRFVFLQVID